MKKELEFEFAGLEFRVKASISDGVVEDVTKVEVLCSTGKYVPVKVDTDQFYEDMQDYLNDAVDDYVLSSKQIHDDYLWEKELEGRKR